MDERPVSYRTCGACLARILWVLTPAGRRMPLDFEPVTDGTGNVVIEERGGVIRGRVLAGAEMPHEGPSYVPHHRTCPAADEYRARRDATTPRCARLDCRLPLDEWLVQQGYTRHIGCLPPPTPARHQLTPEAPATPAEPPAQQGELDFGDAS